MSNQAAWLDEKAGRLRIGETKAPKAGSNEVVIKNHALAINPVDWKQKDYGYFIKEYPVVLGCDVAGEITEVGSGVSKFKIGDRVIGHCIALGTGDSKNAGFQLYTTLPTERVAKIPSSLSFEEGVVLPLAVSTAADGLYQSKADGFLGLPYPQMDTQSTNKVIVVYGGSSSVGAVTIQLAAASGVKVVALASEKNFQFVRDAGASEVIDYKDSDAVDKVVKAVKSLGGEFIGVYDAIALPDQSFNITVPIIKELGGNLATVLPPPKDVPNGSKTGNIFAVNKSTDPVWNEYVEPAPASGKLKAIPAPLVAGTGLKEIQLGLDKNKEGVSAKKVVIKL